MGEGDAKSPRPVPDPETLVLEPRRERVAQVVAHRTRTLVVVLDRLQDPFNMAAVLRTCEAMGVQEVHVIDHPEHPFKPAHRISQGCDKWLDLFRYRAPADAVMALRARGFELWASAVREGGKSLYQLDFGGKRALVFGNERFGVTDEMLDSADGTFWVPMHGFTQSLNVSAAVSASVSWAMGWRVLRGAEGGDLSEQEAAELTRRFHERSVKQGKKIYGRTPTK